MKNVIKKFSNELVKCWNSIVKSLKDAIFQIQKEKYCTQQRELEKKQFWMKNQFPQDKKN